MITHSLLFKIYANARRQEHVYKPPRTSDNVRTYG